MRYLCLLYRDEHALPGRSEMPADSECQAYARDMAMRGGLVAAEALETGRAAMTLRIRDGAISLAEGPVIAVRSELTGFYLIEARDFNRAVQLAAGIPLARAGCVEIRPVRTLDL